MGLADRVDVCTVWVELEIDAPDLYAKSIK